MVVYTEYQVKIKNGSETHLLMVYKTKKAALNKAETYPNAIVVKSTLLDSGQTVERKLNY